MIYVSILVSTRKILPVWLSIILFKTSLSTTALNSIAVTGFVYPASILTNNHNYGHFGHICCLRRTNLLSLKGGLNEGDDFYFEDNEKEALEGQAMAKEFYEQLRSRESAKTNENRSDRKAEEEEEEESVYERKPSSSNVAKKSKKFTGRQGEIDSTGTPSAGLFDRPQGSVYGYPVESNRVSGTAFSNDGGSRSTMVREQMMQSEYRLASMAGGERSILIQLGLALVALCAVLYVGISGGITDGSERLVVEPDPMPDIIDFANTQSSPTINDVIRTSPSDGSIWL